MSDESTRAFETKVELGHRQPAEVTIIGWTDRPGVLIDSVAIHLRTGSIGIDFAGPPEHARAFGEALIAAADAMTPTAVSS